MVQGRETPWLRSATVTVISPTGGLTMKFWFPCEGVVVHLGRRPTRLGNDARRLQDEVRRDNDFEEMDEGRGR